MVSFSRPFEVTRGTYVNQLGHKPGAPDMWLDGDYLVIGTGHRLHMAGGLVAWVKH